MTTPVHRAAARFWSAIACVFFAAGSAPAQTGTAVVEMADRPIVRESLGLRLYLPIGAEAQTYEIGDRTSLAIALPNELGIINIQDSASVEAADLSSICDGIIRNRLGIAPPRQLPRPGQRMGRGALLLRTPNMVINQVDGPTHTAERLYLGVEASDGGRDGGAFMGYTVIKPTPDRVITFELITDRPNFQRAREMYELTVASATIENPDEVAEARRLGVQTGIRWLAEVDQQSITEAVQGIGEEWRWQRLYRPSLVGRGDDAAEEIGYRRIAARVGRRGDMQRQGSTVSGAIANQRGFILRIESRVLFDQLIIDTASVFFLSLDKQHEAWTIEMATRDQNTGQIQRSTEMGIRDGVDMTVSTRFGDQPLETTKPQINGRGYISRVEAFLLPRLLVQTGLPSDYRFYAFQSSSGQVQMRSDELTQLEDGSGRWSLRTRLSQDDEPLVATLGPEGAMLSTVLHDGSRWQPIELSRLGRIWRAKRLPMN